MRLTTTGFSKLMHSFVLALTCIAYTINTGRLANWLHPWLQLHYYSGCISICCSDTKIGIDWLLDGYGTFWKHLKKQGKNCSVFVICSAWNCRPERLDLRDLWTFFGLRKSWRSDCPAIQTCFRRQSSGKRECPPLRPHQSLQNHQKKKDASSMSQGKSLPPFPLLFQIMLSYPWKWISLFGHSPRSSSVNYSYKIG